MIIPRPAAYTIRELNARYILNFRPIKITRNRSNRLSVFGGFGAVYE